ncbi:Vacuolar protein 8 [Nowakowskiella sp. JEL0407]|nr:Vacuolar protein 8 [Nowakowskiella sp. JEL0407]
MCFPNFFCCCCCSIHHSRDIESEPLLPSLDQSALNNLNSYLQHFYVGAPLENLSTLSFANTQKLQRSAALAFAEITERDSRPVSAEVIKPIAYLLKSRDVQVQRCAAAALGNLASNSENKQLIIQQGCLDSLSSLMLSSNVEVQTNSVGCITNLATLDANKPAIINSKILHSLLKLLKSNDIRVQRNASGAVLNLTHSVESRQVLVKFGVISLLVRLLSVEDSEVQYYCITALSNIAVDAPHREMIRKTEPKLVSSLIKLIGSPSPRVKCQSVLALRNLASDDYFQLQIVRENGIAPLIRILNISFPVLSSNTSTPSNSRPSTPSFSSQPSTPTFPLRPQSSPTTKISTATMPLVTAAIACLRNLSIHSDNEKTILEYKIFPILAKLLKLESEEVQSHAINCVRNLVSNHTEKKKYGSQEWYEKMNGFEGMEFVLESVRGILENYYYSDSIPSPSKSKWNGQHMYSAVPTSGLVVEMTACLAIVALNEAFVDSLVSCCGMLLNFVLGVNVNYNNVKTRDVEFETDPAKLEIIGNSGAVFGNMFSKLGTSVVLREWVHANWSFVDEFMTLFLEFIAKKQTESTAFGFDDEILGRVVGWSLIQLLECGGDFNIKVTKMRCFGLLRDNAAIGDELKNEDLANLAQIVLQKAQE